jgi:hypothetical protein
MDRNKHIYALSDGAIVAHSAYDSGGTWSGATENLKHGWVPLSVRAEPPIPEGNRKLIEKGGRPIDRRILREGVDLEERLFTATPLTDIQSSVRSLANADGAEVEEGKPDDQRDTEKTGKEAVLSPNDIREYIEESEPGEAELFPFVWPIFKHLLVETRKYQYVKEFFGDLRPSQAQDWLMMAAERGLAVREERPVRYSLPQDGEEQSDSESVSRSTEDDEKTSLDDSNLSNGESKDGKEAGIQPGSSQTLFDGETG